MNQSEFRQKFNQLLEQELYDLNWTDKLEIINDELVKADQKIEPIESSSSIRKNKQRSIKIFYKTTYHFITTFALFIKLMLQNKGKNFNELMKIVREKVDNSKQINNHKYALDILFPKGHTSIYIEYEKYNKHKRFSTKMERANRLLLKLSSLHKRKVFIFYESFINDFKVSLVEEVIKRANNADSKQAKSDLNIIPNFFGLHELYLDNLKNKSGNKLSTYSLPNIGLLEKEIMHEDVFQVTARAMILLDKSIVVHFEYFKNIIYGITSLYKVQKYE